jgi:hypothetical protein
MHLIWSKDEASDENKTIKELVINAYKDMFFSPNQLISQKKQIKEILSNLLK